MTISLFGVEQRVRAQCMARAPRSIALTRPQRTPIETGPDCRPVRVRRSHGRVAHALLHVSMPFSDSFGLETSPHRGVDLRWRRRETLMLRWAIGFFLVAILAALLGFAGIAGD